MPARITGRDDDAAGPNQTSPANITYTLESLPATHHPGKVDVTSAMMAAAFLAVFILCLMIGSYLYHKADRYLINHQTKDIEPQHNGTADVRKMSISYPQAAEVCPARDNQGYCKSPLQQVSLPFSNGIQAAPKARVSRHSRPTQLI